VKKIFLVIIFSYCVFSLKAQDVNAFSPEGDAKYYNFWEGTWYQVINNKADTSSSRFIVSKTVHPAGWYEKWRMVIDAKTTWTAEAIRAWDKTNNRWMYTWISDNGLFQVWEGRRVGDNWYIYKYFDINGDKYLSRQGWIPVEKNKLMRISEKSYDEGKTWELRFKEYYIKL